MGIHSGITVTEVECIACGSCEELCPEVFRLNEGLGFAQVVNPGGAPDEKIQEFATDVSVNTDAACGAGTRYGVTAAAASGTIVATGLALPIGTTTLYLCTTASATAGTVAG